MAIVLLATVVLPAEYGLDPLHTGAMLGLSALSPPPGAKAIPIPPGATGSSPSRMAPSGITALRTRQIRHNSSSDSTSTWSTNTAWKRMLPCCSHGARVPRSPTTFTATLERAKARNRVMTRRIVNRAAERVLLPSPACTGGTGETQAARRSPSG